MQRTGGVRRTGKREGPEEYKEWEEYGGRRSVKDRRGTEDWKCGGWRPETGGTKRLKAEDGSAGWEARDGGVRRTGGVR